jgi:DnaK suppressor protein
MDEAQAAEAREYAVRNLDRYAHQLRQVEGALRRLDSGEYAICTDCEEAINSKRLRAIPWALRCVKCQKRFDQRAARSPSQIRDEPRVTIRNMARLVA